MSLQRNINAAHSRVPLDSLLPFDSALTSSGDLDTIVDCIDISRVNSMCEVTARSSAFKMANPNPSSSNGKIHAGLPGLCFSADHIRKESLKYAAPVLFLLRLLYFGAYASLHWRIRSLRNPALPCSFEIHNRGKDV